MPTSDKELEKLQDRAQKLRDQLVEARLAREARERESVNDVTAAQLNAEITQLEVELEREKEAGKAKNVQAGIAAPMADATAAMEAAAASAKADEDAKTLAAKSAQEEKDRVAAEKAAAKENPSGQAAPAKTTADKDTAKDKG